MAPAFSILLLRSLLLKNSLFVFLQQLDPKNVLNFLVYFYLLIFLLCFVGMYISAPFVCLVLEDTKTKPNPGIRSPGAGVIDGYEL